MILVVPLFYLSCCNKCVEITLCHLNGQWCGTSFSCVRPSFALFVEMSLCIFCTFSSWTVCFFSWVSSYLYILDMIPLSDTYFASIFWVCSLSFHPRNRVFHRAKSFSILISPDYPFFSFLDHAFVVISKNLSPNPRIPKIFSCVISLKF